MTVRPPSGTLGALMIASGGRGRLQSDQEPILHRSMIWRRFLALSPLARLAFVVSLGLALFMAFDPKPPLLGLEQYGDKLQHSLAFLALTATAQWGFPTMPRWRIAERLSFIGALIEVVQSIPVLHRDCDIRDWCADTIVIVAVTAVFIWGDRWRGRRVGA